MMMAEEAPASAPARKAGRGCASTTIAATGQAQGEFFSYVVGNPVTVRRGRSTMAPILQSEVRLHKERLYNGQKQPRNPVIAMRFKNGSGLTLDAVPSQFSRPASTRARRCCPSPPATARSTSPVCGRPRHLRHRRAGQRTAAGRRGHQGWAPGSAGMGRPVG